MEAFLFIITITLACFLQGVVGFGFALVATPLALIYLEKETVVSSMLVISVVLNGFLTKKIKKPVNFKQVIPLFLASLVGMPVGIWILKAIPINLMKVLVGSLAIISTVILYFGKFRLPQKKFLTAIAGFASGFLQTSTSMSGPPVVLLLAGQKLPKKEFRKTLVSFFFLMGIVSISLFFVSQIITLERVSFGLISIPFVFLAGFLGDKVATRVPQKVFRFLALGVVSLSGLYSIFSGLM